MRMILVLDTLYSVRNSNKDENDDVEVRSNKMTFTLILSPVEAIIIIKSSALLAGFNIFARGKYRQIMTTQFNPP